MVYEAKFVKQLDGSAFQGLNCTCASDAMFINRATAGKQAPTGARIRTLSGDRSGGVNLGQAKTLNANAYNIRSTLFQPISWTDLMAYAKAGRGFILQVYYKAFVGTKHDCFRGRFKDNHSVWVNHMNADGTLRGGDPGADGRYAGCPKGYQNFTQAFLRKAAGELDLSGLATAAYRPLGYGKAYALLAPKDVALPPTPVPPPDPSPYVHVVEVTATSLNVRSQPKASATDVGDLKKGARVKTTKLMKNGGAYVAGGKTRTDWLGYTSSGRTVWIARGFTKLIA